MSDRIKGTLFGIAMSLLAIIAWIIFYFIGIIAGIAGAGMGLLFIWGYKKFNKNDKTKYAVIVACLLIITEIIIAELITIFLMASSEGVTLIDALEINKIKNAVIFDIVIGLLLSFVVFAGFLFSGGKKNRQAGNRVYTHTHPCQNVNGQTGQSAPLDAANNNLTPFGGYDNNPTTADNHKIPSLEDDLAAAPQENKNIVDE